MGSVHIGQVGWGGGNWVKWGVFTSVRSVGEGGGGNWVKWGVLTLVRWVGEGVIGSSGECSHRSGGLGRG